jgi:hypothetical protein
LNNSQFRKENAMPEISLFFDEGQPAQNSYSPAGHTIFSQDIANVDFPSAGYPATVSFKVGVRAMRYLRENEPILNRTVQVIGLFSVEEFARAHAEAVKPGGSNFVDLRRSVIGKPQQANRAKTLEAV